jgi:GNAT superfamily N-acetyltransferase
MDVTIRRARPEEAEALSGLIQRSKAHWGYDPALLESWRQDLTLDPATIAERPVYCAEDAADGALLGVSHFYPLNDEEVYLEDLFVEPAAMGMGVGAALWRHAVSWATAHGAHAIVFIADPNARPFYERMDAVVVGWDESTIVPGRRLPQMRYELPRR